MSRRSRPGIGKTPAVLALAMLALALCALPALLAGATESPTAVPAALIAADDADAATRNGRESIREDPPVDTVTDATTRNGREIYRRFREGLADPTCAPDASTRWRKHFAAAPGRLASDQDDMLALFGYVVDALRAASLPTEYALIPLVESGYKPGARSALGPAGMWQMIRLTARSHQVPIHDGYDGRLSPVESTRAAVRYLKTLHGMFAGDWRLAAMAYNAGEYRVLRALRRGGQLARDARPAALPGLSGITHAYVRKLHALSCLLAQAETEDAWVRAMDRPVPRLQAVTLPAGIDRIGDWAARNGRDAERLRRLNPVFTGGTIRQNGHAPLQLLAIAGPLADVEESAPAALPMSVDIAGNPPTGDTERRHTVVRGDNAWTIARRYGVGVRALLDHNKLTAGSVLRPGDILQIDAPPVAGK